MILLRQTDRAFVGGEGDDDAGGGQEDHETTGPNAENRSGDRRSTEIDGVEKYVLSSFRFKKQHMLLSLPRSRARILKVVVHWVWS